MSEGVECLIVLAYGLIQYDVVATLAGLLATHLGRLWYIDRMVLLFDAMKKTDDQIAAWEY